jgi:tripartite-type tricarboxylate transporter receptor subunit TctC
VHIPYKQSAVTDVASGQVMIGFEPPVSTLPHIKSGRIKALAYTGDKRSTMLPDVPTLAELYPGLEIFTWVGLWAPHGTPAPILRNLQGAIAAATRLPEIQKALADVGNEPMSGTPAQMEAMTLQESDRMGRLIKAKNITVN